MDVSSTDTKRAYSCAAWMPVAFPLGQIPVHKEWRAGKIDLRVRFLIVKTRRNLSVFQREDGFDQSGNAGCRIEVTDVGLHRTDSTKA